MLKFDCNLRGKWKIILSLISFAIARFYSSRKNQLRFAIRSKMTFFFLLLVLLLFCVSSTESEKLHVKIEHLLQKLPELIKNAKEKIETKENYNNLEAHSQGASVIVAGWKNIFSNWIISNSTGNVNELWRYGQMALYSLAYGARPILTRPRAFLSCGVSVSDISLDVELESKLRSRLNCILSKRDKYIEAAEVEWAIQELVAALTFTEFVSAGIPI